MRPAEGQGARIIEYALPAVQTCGFGTGPDPDWSNISVKRASHLASSTYTYEEASSRRISSKNKHSDGSSRVAHHPNRYRVVWEFFEGFDAKGEPQKAKVANNCCVGCHRAESPSLEAFHKRTVKLMQQGAPAKAIHMQRGEGGEAAAAGGARDARKPRTRTTIVTKESRSTGKTYYAVTVDGVPTGKTMWSLAEAQAEAGRVHAEVAAAGALPKSAESEFARGKTLQGEKRWADAAEAFRAATALDPELGGAWFALGYCAGEEGGGGADEGIAAYRQAIRINPKHANALYGLGGLLLNKRKDIDGAEAAFRAAVEADPKHANALYGLGKMLVLKTERTDLLKTEFRMKYRTERKDIDGAEAAFRAAIAADPKHAKAQYSLALLLSNERKDIDGALAANRAAIRIDPKPWRPHFNLGVLLLNQRNDLDGAEAAFRGAIVADPKNAEAQRALDIVLKKKAL
jgi:tetratricopeptide (TPR) repeat protein